MTVDPHPLLAVSAFTSSFEKPLGASDVPGQILQLHDSEAAAPFQPDESVRRAVRDLLRWGGYKPTGRGKPASEYLVRVAGEGALSSINLAVDVCNAVSMHSGLPISVVDLGRVQEPLHIGVAAAGAKYVFNAAGQEIDLSGLICLHDADGPCANAVRDSQRTKTSAETVTTLSVVWAPVGSSSRLEGATAWYRELLAGVGALTAAVDT